MIDNIWLLIYKKLNGGATPEQLQELEQRVKDDKHLYHVEILDHIWKNTFNKSDKSNLATDEKWNRLEARLNVTATRSLDPDLKLAKKRRWYKYAATACVLLAGLLFWFRSAIPSKKDNQTEINAPLGAITKIQLPDGSTVVLNAGSKITYPNSFSETHRELYLSGEAFFDVVKDREHPFIVTTQNIKIKVLGTRFNVRAYLNEKTSAAALLKGSIELTVLKNPDRQIILKPSEKITVTNTSAANVVANGDHLPSGSLESIELTQIHQAKKDSLPSEVAWMEYKIVFDDQEMMEIAKMMERKYDIDIGFSNEGVKHLKFTGKFENVSLNEALKQLQVIANFSFKIKNKKVTISN